MPYFISQKEAAEKAQYLLDDRVGRLKLFFRYHPELSHITFIKPRIHWRGMGKRVAGCCHLQDHVIEMNTNYLSSTDYKLFVVSTLVHELAHSIAYDLFKDCGHGTGWKWVAKFLGDDGNRCHNYNEPTVNKIDRKGY